MSWSIWLVPTSVWVGEVWPTHGLTWLRECAFTCWRPISPLLFLRNSAIGCKWGKLAPLIFLIFYSRSEPRRFAPLQKFAPKSPTVCVNKSLVPNSFRVGAKISGTMWAYRSLTAHEHLRYRYTTITPVTFSSSLKSYSWHPTTICINSSGWKNSCHV